MHSSRDTARFAERIATCPEHVFGQWQLQGRDTTVADRDVRNDERAAMPLSDGVGNGEAESGAARRRVASPEEALPGLA